MIHQFVVILLDFVNVGEAAGARGLPRDTAGVKNTSGPDWTYGQLPASWNAAALRVKENANNAASVRMEMDC